MYSSISEMIARDQIAVELHVSNQSVPSRMARCASVSRVCRGCLGGDMAADESPSPPGIDIVLESRLDAMRRDPKVCTLVRLVPA